MNKEMKELLKNREEMKIQAMEEIENILAIAEDRIVKATEESIKDVIEVATEIVEEIMDETRADIEEMLERLIYKGNGKKKRSKKFNGICNCIGNPSPFAGNPYMDDDKKDVNIAFDLGDKRPSPEMAANISKIIVDEINKKIDARDEVIKLIKIPVYSMEGLKVMCLKDSKLKKESSQS